jgi:hypothetical protein
MNIKSFSGQSQRAFFTSGLASIFGTAWVTQETWLSKVWLQSQSTRKIITHFPVLAACVWSKFQFVIRFNCPA